MKTEYLQKVNLLFDRFKESIEYQKRLKQLKFCDIAKKVIFETISDKITNDSLTGFIQMFKVNSSVSTFERYLKLNIKDETKNKDIMNTFDSLELRGYTAAGRFKIKNLTDEQLEKVRLFLLSAFDVKDINDAVSLIKQFESYNLPEVKKGIYSPWLHYINPNIFPIINSTSKRFIKWLEMSNNYTDQILEFNKIRSYLNLSDLGLIDSFIYKIEKSLVGDNIHVKLFSMSLSDEKLKEVYDIIKENKNYSEYSKIIKEEYYFRYKIEDNIKRFWVLGAFTSLKDINLKGDKDRTEYFTDKGIWINGYKNRYNEIVNSIKVGDVVAIKSVYVKDGKSTMRIRNTGIVTNNLKDGRTIEVNWKKGFEQFDLYFTGGYWSTITEVKNEEHINSIWLD